MGIFTLTKKYHCENGHSFRSYKLVDGKKCCPKCGSTSLYKKA